MIGSAVAGKWKSQMPEAAITEIESAWGGLMTQLGYELVMRKTQSLEPMVSSTRIVADQAR